MQRIYELKKSGNSTVIRIPYDELKANDCAAGDKVIMSFHKVKTPRKNWFDQVTEAKAQKEAELMNKDFANVDLELTDEWGTEW